MPANKEGKELRKNKVLEKRAEGKPVRQIAEELTNEGMPVSKDTVWRDWKELRQDDTIQEALEELRLANLNNALVATKAENAWLQDKQFGDFGHEVMGKVTNAKIASQKTYSFLAGENANDKGGEKGVSEEQRQMATELLSKFLNG